MATYESDQTIVLAACQQVYHLLADMRNYGALMPEQIKNWEATSDTCRFLIEGMGSFSMQMKSKTPGQNVHICSVDDKPVPYTLDFFLSEAENGHCRLRVAMEVKIGNPLVASLAKRPLMSLVNKMANRLQSSF